METLETRVLLTCVPSGPDLNNQICEASPLAVGDSVAGKIEFSSDVNMYAVEVIADQTVRFEMDGYFDSFLRLFDSAGNPLPSDDDSGPGLGARVDFTSATTRTVFAGISGFGNNAYNPVDGTGASSSSSNNEAYGFSVTRVIAVDTLVDDVDAFTFNNNNCGVEFRDPDTNVLTQSDCNDAPGGTLEQLLRDKGPDGKVSLREAIVAANETPGHQTIKIIPSGTINIPQPFGFGETTGLENHRVNPALGAFKITDDLTISSEAGNTLSALAFESGEFAGPLGSQYHRVLEVKAPLYGPQVSLQIDNLTIENGKVPPQGTDFDGLAGGGGGIRFESRDILLLTNSKVVGNESRYHGGGISADGIVVLEHSSEVSGNKTVQGGAIGGGIFAPQVIIRDSEVSGNATTKNKSSGGGIGSYGTIYLDNATIRDNSTDGEFSHGGGMFASGIEITNDSVVEGNFTKQEFSQGGGAYSTGALVIDDSRFEDNSTRGGVPKLVEITCNLAINVLESVVTGGFAGELGGPGLIDLLKVIDLSARAAFADDLPDVSNQFVGIVNHDSSLFSVQNASINKRFGFIDWSPCPGSKGSGGRGGGAFGARVKVTDSDFVGNYTGTSFKGDAADGGAIFATQIMQVDDSTFTGNRTNASNARGGALAIGKGIESTPSIPEFPSRMYVNNTVFESNSTEGSSGSFGGAIYAGRISRVTIKDSLFESNGTQGDSGHGGAIFSRGGELNILDSTFVDNSTKSSNSNGGAVSGVDIRIQQSVFQGNETVSDEPTAQGGLGGAVKGESVTVQDTLFENNTAGGEYVGPRSDGSFDLAGGGAIYAGKHVNIVNSAFLFNAATGDKTQGGAVFAPAGVIKNSAFQGNRANGDNANGGAIAVLSSAKDGSFINVLDSTISGNAAENNGGGIHARNNGNFNAATVLVSGGVVSGNIALGSGDDVDIERLFTARPSIIGEDRSDVRIIDYVSNFPIFRSAERTYAHRVPFLIDGERTTQGVSQNTSLQVGCTLADCDTFFNASVPLLQNVGDYIQPAISDSFLVTTSLEYDNSPRTTTLREAVSFVDSSPANSQVLFSPSLAGHTLELSGDAIEITSTMLINAPPQKVTIDIQGDDRIFHYTETSGGSLTLSNLILMNGKTSGSLQGGGAIKFDSDDRLNLINVDIRNSSTEGTQSEGGSIAAPFGGLVSLTNSKIFNSATTGPNSDGGAISADEVHLIQSLISQATTHGDNSDGGAINADNVTLIGSEISSSGTKGNNSDGGAISADAVALFTSWLVGNTTKRDDSNGGALNVESLDSRSSEIVANRTYGVNSKGGAVYATGLVLSTNDIVSSNSTGSDNSGGGAFHVSDLYAQGTNFSSNFSKGNNSPGGAVYSAFAPRILDSKITHNSTSGTASPGGGVYSKALSVPGEVTLSTAVQDSLLFNNETTGDQSPGGAIYDMGNVELVDTDFNGNQTGGLESGGGAVYSKQFVRSGSPSTFFQNRTLNEDSPGGAFHAANIEIDNATIAENGTGGDDSPGGALYSTGKLHLSQTTISRNSTGGQNSHGGGLRGGDVALSQNTITGNSTATSTSDGGGVYASSTLKLIDSIVLGNYANNNSASSNHEITLGAAGGFVRLQGTSIVAETSANFPPLHGCYFPNGNFYSSSQQQICFPSVPGIPASQQPAKYTAGTTINASLSDVFANLENLKVDSNNDAKRDLTIGTQQAGAPRTNGNSAHTVALNPDINNPSLDKSNGESTSSVTANGGPPPTLASDARGGSRFVDLGAASAATGSVRTEIPGDLNGDGQVSFVDFLVLSGNFGESTDAYHQGDIDGDGVVGFSDFLQLSQNFALSGEGRGRVVAVGPIDVADLGTIELETLIPEAGIVDPFVVTTLADSEYEFDHRVSLREAIANANDTPGPNTVTFDPSLNGETITLVDHDADGLDINLAITDDLTIDASDLTDGIKIDADHLSRVLHFSAPTGSLTMVNLTLTNGEVEDQNGGAVLFESTGNLSITNSQISNSATRGPDALGGGIYSAGIVFITGSAIYGNNTLGSGANGGGLFVDGSATIQNSTFFGNTTNGEGAEGGGIYADILSLNNSTFTGNETRLGIGSSGAVYVGSNANINNSVLLSNSAPRSAGDEIGGATGFTVAFGGHNIVGTDIVAFEATDTNVQNAAFLDVFTDGALADNGGVVKTIALKPSTTNPALDAGTDSLSSDINDARNAQRKVDLTGILGTDQIDLGAYELQASTTELPGLVVTTNSDVVDASDFATSLREAIIFANDLTAGDQADGDADNDGLPNDTITFVDFGTDTTIELNGLLPISTSLTINGPVGDQLTIDADGTNQRIFNITDSAATIQDVTIRSLTLTGGGTTSAAHSGGAIMNRENLSLIDSTVTGNRGSDGGGIFNSGTMYMSGSTISNNTSTGSGGGLQLTTASTAYISASEISGNVAAGNGGGIDGRGALTIEDSTISGNTADQRGGGIHLQSTGLVEISNTTISGNAAKEIGGGLANIGVLAAGSSVVNATITGNRADSDGISPGQAGGLFDNFSSIELHNSILAGNFRGTGSSPSDIDSGLGAASHNIVGSAATFVPPTLAHGTNGNMVGINGSGTKPTVEIIDLMLADNGGQTKTHALVTDSPAIDLGGFLPSFFQLADQVGAQRGIDGNGDGVAANDIGAVEMPAATVAGRFIFYNDSAFDGNIAAANAADDGAIADKKPLFPGETASFDNYTSYSKGINGIMIDIANLPSTNLTANDFSFEVGNDDSPVNWGNNGPVPAPTSITVRQGEGFEGSDRITITWADNVIQKQWLEVTVKATSNTGLATPDVHYWGNAIGETGNSPTDTLVNAQDIVDTRDNGHFSFNPASVDDAYDFNRDKLVNAADIIIARDNGAFSFNSLKLITPAGPPPPPPVTAATVTQIVFAEHATEINGDLDGDLATGFADFLTLSQNFGNENAKQEDGDLTGDGVVGFENFLLLAASFGQQ